MPRSCINSPECPLRQDQRGCTVRQADSLTTADHEVEMDFVEPLAPPKACDEGNRRGQMTAQGAVFGVLILQS